MQNSSFIRELQASRKLGSEINLQQHMQDLRRSKLERELESLSKSRRNFVESQINKTHQEYEDKIKQNVNIFEQHINRIRRSQAERARVAHADHQRNRQRLLKERNLYDELDKQNRQIQKNILSLQTKSRNASEDEDRLIRDLNNRKIAVLKLIDESKQRQLYHYNQAKNLSNF